MANNTVNVNNATELVAALANAVSQPISCINIMVDVIQIAGPLYLPKTLATPSKTLIINGNGATIQPSGLTALPVLIQRVPSNQVEATGSMDDYKFVIRDLNFNGKNGGVGLELGASVGSVVENCTFSNLITGLYLKYCPSTKVMNCTANVGGMGFVASYGDWTNATTQNTQSGNTRFEQCRVNVNNGGYAGFVIHAANNVVLDQCVVEGGTPNYHVFFDSIGSPLVKSLTIRNMYLDATASLAGLKLRLAGGYAKIDGLYSQLDMTLVSAESAGGYPHLYVENVPWMSSGTRFETLGSAVVWSFKEILYGEQLSSTMKWVNGTVPYFYYSEYFNESKGIITNLMKVNNKTIS